MHDLCAAGLAQIISVRERGRGKKERGENETGLN